MTFAEWVLWLASSAALGVVASYLLTLIKMVFPAVKDTVAKIASGLLAAVICGLAVQILPYLGQVPAWVETYWPILVWAVSQIWYELTKPKES